MSRVRLSVLAALVAITLAASAALQEPSGTDSSDPRPALFLREDPVAAHALSLAEGYEQAGAWAEAATEYQKVLDLSTDPLVPVDADGHAAPQGSSRYESARGRALRRLSAWPSEGRLLLAERTEIPAMALWLHAGSDAPALERLVRRYPFSSVGDQAMDRLGEALLESGDPCGALAAWSSLRRLRPDSPLADFAGRKMDAVRELLGGEPALSGENVPASPSRPGLPRWSFIVDPQAGTLRRDCLRRGLVQPSPYFPVLSGDEVLLSGAGGISVLDRVSGRLLWSSGDPVAGSRRPSEGPLLAASSASLCLAVLDGRLAAFQRRGGLKVWETPGSAEVVTPPSVRGGIVYVGVLVPSGPSVSYEAWALLARDGRILWKRALASSFDAGLLTDGLRGGLLLLPSGVAFNTEMGCLAALDFSSGDILWLTRYETLGESERRRAQRLSHRWNPGRPLFSGGYLLAAPRDCGALLCVSAADGALRWREPRRASDALLAASEGRVFLSGPGDVRALGLEDRKPLWTALLEVEGLGCLGSEGLVLPGTEGPVLLSPANGSVLHRDLWCDEALKGANLVVQEGLVLACSPGLLVAFEPESVTRARLAKSPDALASGRLALAQGDPDAALQAFSRGNGPAAQEGLAEAEALKARSCEKAGHWAEAAEAFSRASKRAPDAPRRLAWTSREGGNWRKARRPALAVAAFQRMIEDASGGTLPWEGAAAIRADWAGRLSIEEILENDEEGGREAYGDVEMRAARCLAALSPGMEESELRDLIRHFPNSQAALRAMEDLHRRHALRGIASAPAFFPRLAWRMRRGEAYVPPPSFPAPSSTPPASFPLLCTSDQDGLQALDPATGALRWQRVGNRGSRSPIWASGIVVLADGDTLLGLSPQDGKTLWEIHAQGRILSLWPLPDGGIVAETLTQALFVDRDGRERLRLDLGAPLAAAPLAVGKLLLAVTTSSGVVPAKAHWLDLSAGKEVATAGLGTDGVGAVEAMPSSGSVLILLGSRRVLALPLDPSGGTAPRWEKVSETPRWQGLFAGEAAGIVVLTPVAEQENPRLQALSLAAGKPLWESEILDVELSSVQVIGGSLLAGLSSPGRSGAASWALDSGVQNWRTDLWSQTLQVSCIPLSSGILLWACGQDEAAILDAATGKVLRSCGGLSDSASVVLPFSGGFLWVGTYSTSAWLPEGDLDALRPLWRARSVRPSGENPRQALALADARFHAGVYGEALQALGIASLGNDPNLKGEIEARQEPWRETEALLAGEVLKAQHFRTPPQIDGDLRDGWAERLRRDLRLPADLRAFAKGGPNAVWSGEPDLSSRVYVGWDQEFLYFAVDVDDQKQVVFDDQQPGKGDLLFFAIDARGDGRSPFQGGVAIQNPRPKPPDPATLPPGDYAARRRTDDSGTVYEGAIPWSALRGGPPPEEGELRLNLLIGDDDGDGLRKGLLLAPGFPTRRFDEDASGRIRMAPPLFLRVRLSD